VGADASFSLQGRRTTTRRQVSTGNRSGCSHCPVPARPPGSGFWLLPAFPDPPIFPVPPLLKAPWWGCVEVAVSPVWRLRHRPPLQVPAAWPWLLLRALCPWRARRWQLTAFSVLQARLGGLTARLDVRCEIGGWMGRPRATPGCGRGTLSPQSRVGDEEVTLGDAVSSSCPWRDPSLITPQGTGTRLEVAPSPLTGLGPCLGFGRMSWVWPGQGQFSVAVRAGRWSVGVALSIALFIFYILLLIVVAVTVPFVCCSVTLPLSPPRSFCLFLSILLPTPAGEG